MHVGTGVTIVHKGECGSRVFPDGDEGEVGEYCLCYTDEYDPVCGKDGEQLDVRQYCWWCPWVLRRCTVA